MNSTDRDEGDIKEERAAKDQHLVRVCSWASVPGNNAFGLDCSPQISALAHQIISIDPRGSL